MKEKSLLLSEEVATILLKRILELYSQSLTPCFLNGRISYVFQEIENPISASIYLMKNRVWLDKLHHQSVV
jgi:hypothetical protein